MPCNKYLHSRIFILLNRNIAKEHKYTVEEVQSAFNNNDYTDLSMRSRMIFSRIFKEFDSFDLELLKMDFDIDIDKFKSILLSSPYKNDKYILDVWKECLKLETDPIVEKKQFKIKKSERIEKILENRRSNI